MIRVDSGFITTRGTREVSLGDLVIRLGTIRQHELSLIRCSIIRHPLPPLLRHHLLSAVSAEQRLQPAIAFKALYVCLRAVSIRTFPK